MNRNQIENILKYPFFKYFLPTFTLILSFYFWVTFLEIDIFEILGLTINLIGLAMWWSAKLTMAANWNLGFGKPKITQLVTHGVYSRISHPMYWGINLTFIGLTIIYQNTWFAVISLIIIFYFLTRMRRETKYLTETLGEKYQKYKKQTWL